MVKALDAVGARHDHLDHVLQRHRVRGRVDRSGEHDEVLIRSLVHLPRTEEHAGVLFGHLLGQYCERYSRATGCHRPDVADLELIEPGGAAGNRDSLNPGRIHLKVQTEITSVHAVRQLRRLQRGRDPWIRSLLPLPGHTEAATTNWLHRRLPGLKLEVFDFRAPTYLAADDRTGYWNQVEGTARDRRVIFLGDFNCDPFTDARPCTQVFPRLHADGFRLPEPKGDWSYHPGNGHSGSRIDHTLAGPSNGHGPALSDRALLSIRVPRST